MKKKKIDVYSFFSNEIAQILNLATSDYEMYSEATSQPLPLKLYELYLCDIPVFRFSLVRVWTMDYCIKNKIRVNFYQLNDAGGGAFGRYLAELFKLQNYPNRKAIRKAAGKIKKDGKVMAKKIDKIHNRFWNSRLFVKTSEEGRVSDFLKWYIRYIISMYKVKSSDETYKSALSDLVCAEAETIVPALQESMQKELDK